MNLNYKLYFSNYSVFFINNKNIKFNSLALNNRVLFFFLKKEKLKLLSKTKIVNKNNNALNTIVNFLSFAGKKNFSYKVFSKFFENLSIFLFLERNYLMENYIFVKEFIFNLKSNKNLNNMCYVFDWLIFWYRPIFTAKCYFVPKKYRKKLKKKYLVKIQYVDRLKRKNVALKNILLHSSNYSNYSIYSRITLNMFDTIFNFKDSKPYKRKLQIYKKLLKKN